jgi:hypothetical protein
MQQGTIICGFQALEGQTSEVSMLTLQGVLYERDNHDTSCT